MGVCGCLLSGCSRGFGAMGVMEWGMGWNDTRCLILCMNFVPFSFFFFLFIFFLFISFLYILNSCMHVRLLSASVATMRTSFGFHWQTTG